MAAETKASRERRKHLEARLDEALEESFPASDVPSIEIAPAAPKKSRAQSSRRSRPDEVTRSASDALR